MNFDFQNVHFRCNFIIFKKQYYFISLVCYINIPNNYVNYFFVDSRDEEDIKKEEEENIKPKKPLPKKGYIDFTPNALL